MENKNIKILAIDDSNDNLVTIKALLKDSFLEARIFTALTGLKGIELAVAEDPDVILLDVVMPNMDGFETCKRLKTNICTQDIPVVFVTAIQDDSTSRVLALKSGGDAFLAKPIDESELIAQVRAMIKIKAAIKEKRSENERLQLLVKKQTEEIRNMYDKILILYNALEKKTKTQTQKQAELQESKERFAKLFNTSPDIAIITRLSDGLIVEANERFTKASGYSHDEAVGKSSLELNLYHYPADRQAIVDDLSKYGSIKNKEITFRRKDESLFPGLMSSTIIQIDGITHITTNIRDITDLKEVEKALKESNEKFSLLYSSMSQGLALHEIITDNQNNPIDYRFLSMNESFERLTGLKSHEVIGKTILEILPHTEDFWIKSYGRVALTGKAERFDNYSNELKRYFSVTAYSPKPRQFAVLTEDITDRKMKEEKILYINNHDFLTDLYNRRYFEESFQTLHDSNHLPLGIMMFDVNGLKIINDAYGHGTGDQALKSVAAVLQETFETKDIVARIGGDEFVALIPNTTLEIMQRYKEAIVLNCSKKTIKNLFLSLAIGYEIMSDSNKTLDEMLKLTENHMYRHKIVEGTSVRNNAIQAILSTLTEKYEPEKIHSKRVSAFCQQIGEALLLNPEDLKELAMAGMFHDIGKISIPDAIIEKPGKLTALEYETIQTHTEIGYQILRAADQYSDLAVHALSHHERWDGKGYPSGLKGEQIPLYSRIIGIADAFEAMTGARPYKKPIKFEQAIIELKRCSGSQFDSDLVKVFIEQVLPKQR